LDKGSSAAADERSVWVTDYVANGYASRFANDWNFVCRKYSEIKSEDKTLDVELERRLEDFTSRGCR
jgi:hypothetical protein